MVREAKAIGGGCGNVDHHVHGAHFSSRLPPPVNRRLAIGVAHQRECPPPSMETGTLRKGPRMGLTKKQLATRLGGVGASEIAVLAGLSRWSTPAAIFEAKVRGRPELDSYAVDLGTEMEAPIARVWAKRNNRTIAMVDTLAHPDRVNFPLAIATPDRAFYRTPLERGDARAKKVDVRSAEGILQVKSTNWRMRRAWGADGSADVPEEYLVQAQWEGSVAGKTEVVFAVDFDKTALHEFRVPVREELFHALYEVAAKFWRDHVMTGRPPPPDGSDAYSEFQERWFPKDNGAPLATPDEKLEATIREFLLLRAVDARLKARKDLLYQEITNAIGEGTGFESPTVGRLTYKRTKDGVRTDWKAVAMDALRIAGLVANMRPMFEHDQPLRDDLAGLIATHTKTVNGHRSLRCTKAPPLLQEGKPLFLTDGAIDLHVESTTTKTTTEGEDS
jgi:predicted phage-related endonuclease